MYGGEVQPGPPVQSVEKGIKVDWSKGTDEGTPNYPLWNATGAGKRKRRAARNAEHGESLERQVICQQFHVIGPIADTAVRLRVRFPAARAICGDDARALGDREGVDELRFPARAEEAVTVDDRDAFRVAILGVCQTPIRRQPDELGAVFQMALGYGARCP